MSLLRRLGSGEEDGLRLSERFFTICLRNTSASELLDLERDPTEEGDSEWEKSGERCLRGGGEGVLSKQTVLLRHDTQLDTSRVGCAKVTFEIHVLTQVLKFCRLKTNIYN